MTFLNLLQYIPCRYIQEILEITITADIFPVRSLRKHKENSMQQFLQFSQNARRTMGTIEFTGLYIQYETLIPCLFIHTWDELLCWNQWDFCYWFKWNRNSDQCLLTLSWLREILKKKPGKLHHRNPIHYSNFSYGRGKKCFDSMGRCDVYLVQQFALSQSAVFIQKRSSVLQISGVTVDNENIFFSLIWLLILLRQLFIAHFHCLEKKNKEHMKC